MFAFCLWVNAHNDANAAESEMVSRKVALCMGAECDLCEKSH